MSLAAKAEEFQRFVHANEVARAQGCLNELKLGLVQLSSSANDAVLARTILEAAALLSIKQKDMTAFERHVNQVKSYWTDYQLAPSQYQTTIWGLKLFHLLIENRMAEFHTELEVIPMALHTDPNIAFAMSIEQGLMEGSYSKVLNVQATLPNEYWQPLMNKLLATVRLAIADCMEVAYATLTLSEAQEMLKLSTLQQLQAFVDASKPNWKVSSTQIDFQPPEKTLGASDIPALTLVQDTLAYATELDRIV